MVEEAGDVERERQRGDRRRGGVAEGRLAMGTRAADERIWESDWESEWS